MNVRALPAPLGRFNWRPLAVIGLALLIWINVIWAIDVIVHGTAADWDTFTAVAVADSPFDVALWRWSPVAAWVTTLIVPMGLVAWRTLHIVALLAIPDWRWRIGALISWPFWWDVMAGNVMVFVLVAAYWALRRHPFGIFATLLLALLIPRALMLPLVAWILWQEPAWRLRFAGMFIVFAGLTLLTGHGGEWMARLITSAGEMSHPENIAPSAVIGVAWVLVAWPLAWLAFRRGWIGAACVLANPYVFPYYLLLAPLTAARSGEPMHDRG